MADTDTDTGATPMRDADTQAATPGDTLRAAAPTKTTGDAAEAGGFRPADAKQALRDGADKVQRQATERARTLMADGKDKAVGAIGQVSRLLNDAAGDIDSQLGEQYGRYARSAADTVGSFADGLQAKDIADLLDDARALIRKSPAAAAGVAAALGFVVARLVQSGIESDRA